MLALLETHLADDTPNLDPLRGILLALIEDGQRHDMHGHNDPTWGVHACARKGSTSKGREYVYCRYLFPKPLLKLDWDKLALVVDDEHRPGLRNLCFSRNDSVINSYEDHLLLANIGNVDWRPLLNLWAVLDYLTKYNAKAGKGSKKLAHVFTEVLDQICTWDTDNGLHDLWRRMIFKCYSRVLGGRDYSLLETLHVGLRLPGTISSFGDVRSISISDWTSLKRRTAIGQAEDHERISNLSKLEYFNRRRYLDRSPLVHDPDLQDLSMYAFWRLFDVVKNKIAKKRKYQFVALNGIGLLLFLLPGVIAFAVDFSTGAIYLPGTHAANEDELKTYRFAGDLTQDKFDSAYEHHYGEKRDFAFEDLQRVEVSDVQDMHRKLAALQSAGLARG